MKREGSESRTTALTPHVPRYNSVFPTDVAAGASLGENGPSLVREGIQALSEHYRTALTLYHLEGMSVSQIGEVTDNPEGTIKSHLYRGRKKLKDWLLDRYQREELTP